MYILTKYVIWFFKTFPPELIVPNIKQVSTEEGHSLSTYANIRIASFFEKFCIFWKTAYVLSDEKDK